MSNNAIVVGTYILVEEWLALDPNIQTLGQDIGTKKVKICKIVYVPPMFVSCMLEDEMTP